MKEFVAFFSLGPKLSAQSQVAERNREAACQDHLVARLLALAASIVH